MLMSKYTPLADYLQKASGQKKAPVEVSFRDLEKVLGFKLPSSAYRQRTWWSNNVHNNVMTRVWKKAGFVTEDVDMTKEKVVFRNKQEPSIEFLTREIARETKHRQSKTKAHPLRGALKGTLRLVRGTDLTKPADPGWSDR
jgi:hypothetical protein